MPDQEIKIVTTADTAGAQAAAAAMKEVEGSTEAAAAATKDFNTAQLGAVTPLTTASRIAQNREILALELEISRAREQGDIEGAAAMEQRAAAMRLSLQAQSQAMVGEIQATAIAGEIVSQKIVETGQMKAQAALNAELVAAETQRLAIEGEMQEALNARLVAEEALRQATEAQAVALANLESEALSATVQRAAILEEIAEARAREAISAAAVVEQDRIDAQMNQSMAAIEAQRLATEEAITAEKAAQNEEDATGNTLRGLGTAGRGAGMLASGLGLGQLAGSIAFAVFGLIEGVRWINEWIKGLNTSVDQSEKLGASITEYNSKLAERISLIKNDQQESEVRASIEEKISSLQEQQSQQEEKIVSSKGIERDMARQNVDLIGAEIGLLNRKLSSLDQITQAVRDQAAAEAEAAEAQRQYFKDVDSFESERVRTEKEVHEAGLSAMSPAERLAALAKDRSDLLGAQPGADQETPESLLALARQNEAADPERAKALVETASELLHINQEISRAKEEQARSDQKQIEAALSPSGARARAEEAAAPSAVGIAADQARVAALEAQASSIATTFKTDAAEGNRFGSGVDLSQLTAIINELSKIAEDLGRNKADKSRVEQDIAEINARIASYRPGL